MAWRVEFSRAARADLASLDTVAQRRILKYLRERVAGDDNPRRLGKALRGEQAGFWRYRVGDYRLLCRIEDQASAILVLAAGHRREIYR